MLKKIKSLVISHWTLVIILIIASFLRLHNLTELPPGLYPDEAMNGNNAAETLETGNFKVFYPENFGREGLFINIQALFIRQFGHQPWALRLPSAIFGILTVLGLYFFAKELFRNKNVALLAAFLLAASFWHTNFSRIGFRAIMAPAFLVWALYFLFLSFRKSQQSPITSYWPLVAAAVGGLLYGLGFHSYIAYRTTPLLIVFIGYFLCKNHSDVLKNIRVIFALFAITAILAVLPLGIYFVKNPADFFGRTAGISIFNSETPIYDLAFNKIKTLGMFNFVGDFNWRHNVAGRPLLFWPVGIFFLSGIYLSLRKIIKEKSRLSPESVVWIWFLTAFLPVVISNEGLPHALRSLLMAPPVFILASIGGFKIYEFLKLKLNRRLLSVVVYVFCSLLLFESYVTYFITWSQNPNVKNAFSYNDFIIAEQLNQLPKELPKYAVVSDAQSAIERDNPISLQSILFLTDTFTDKKRMGKNILYLSKNDFENKKLPGSSIVIHLP